MKTSNVAPFTVLNAVASTGAGASVDLGGVAREFTLAHVESGSPTSASITLQGSHDGTNWFPLIQYSGAGDVYPQVASSTAHFARYVRGYVGSLSGGTSPTITATVAVGEIF